MFKDKVSILSNEFMELKTDANISIKDRIDFKDKTLIVNFTIINKPAVWTKGVFNRTEDGKFICFLDYDYTKLDYIKGELELFQELFSLGDTHIFQSSEKGFHAVSFAKMCALDYMEILNNSSCCQAFKYTPRFVSYQNWILRNFSKGKTPRPKYLYTIKAQTSRLLLTGNTLVYFIRNLKKIN